MVAAYSNRQEKHYQAIEQLIQHDHIGGIIFFQGDPISQVTLTNRYQQKAKIPLLIAMDAEWGLGMRLSNAISYPKQMTLGAIQDNQLIYQMGTEIARQLKLLGVHINFAPVLDIHTNPNNPGIGIRSFGDNKSMVSNKGLAYIRGLQDQGSIAVAKHFPGMGDANKDAHYVRYEVAHTKCMQKHTGVASKPHCHSYGARLGNHLVLSVTRSRTKVTRGRQMEARQKENWVERERIAV